MKSLCIKTNNSDLISYLLNELGNIELENVCFSCNQFKHYRNIIIHYTGSNTNLFLQKISSMLSFLVIDELEEDLLKRLIFQNYFYFDLEEREQILGLCFDMMANDFHKIFDNKFQILNDYFLEFISSHKSLVFSGFVNFRIKKYLNLLDDIVNTAVNQYVVEKEYLEFISLLKLYINSQSSNINVVHIVYSNSESILLDENKEIIMVANDGQIGRAHV